MYPDGIHTVTVYVDMTYVDMAYVVMVYICMAYTQVFYMYGLHRTCSNRITRIPVWVQDTHLLQIHGLVNDIMK